MFPNDAMAGRSVPKVSAKKQTSAKKDSAWHRHGQFPTQYTARKESCHSVGTNASARSTPGIDGHGTWGVMIVRPSNSRVESTPLLVELAQVRRLVASEQEREESPPPFWVLLLELVQIPPVVMQRSRPDVAQREYRKRGRRQGKTCIDNRSSCGREQQDG